MRPSLSPQWRPRTSRSFAALALAAVLLASPAVAVAAAPETPVGTAAAAGSQLILTTTQFSVGESVTVDFATDRPTAKNWVAIYPASAAGPCSGCGYAWKYAPGASGTVTVALHDRNGGNLPAGSYRVEYLYNDGWTRVSDPVDITIVGTAPAGPGNPNAPVEIDPVATTTETDGVIVREGFSGSAAPAGWTADATAGDAWSFTTRADWTASIDQMRGRFARPLATLAVADAQQAGGAIDTTLTGAPVSVAGLGAVRLTFDSHYRGAPGQSGLVRASFDGAPAQEVLRLDSSTVTDGYDARQMNAAQDIVVEVPAGAREVVFSWQLTAPEGGRYWAIDSVAVHQVQRDRAAGDGVTQAWIMSDIQGHPHDWQHAIGDYAEIAPDADGMLVVGDIVHSGAASEWDEVYAVRDGAADVLPRQLVAAMGNHERYAAGGFEANRDRFLAFAERDRVWGEYVLDGGAGELPVIVLGQEFAGPSDVAMSDAQVEFLEERLAHWTALDKQVLVLTHYPLGDTVSASWIPSYHSHHQMNARLTSILGNYPNAIIFTGHTHYPAELGDWAVQRRTSDGHADGFWAVNTLAMHMEWDAQGENTAGVKEVVTRDINRGLTLDSYGDRVVITAHDFADDTQLRQLVIPNPLVDFGAVTAQPPAPQAPAWVAGSVYVAGDVVSHDGAAYVAQWWTTETPGVSVHGSWMERGAQVSCAAGEVPSWTASHVYTGGERVAREGQVYEARWWTRNQQPENAGTWGPWALQGAC